MILIEVMHYQGVKGKISLFKISFIALTPEVTSLVELILSSQSCCEKISKESH